MDIEGTPGGYIQQFLPQHLAIIKGENEVRTRLGNPVDHGSVIHIIRCYDREGSPAGQDWRGSSLLSLVEISIQVVFLVESK